ncbi:hypothetical protein [Ruania zhangjianzhongii]|uniref:hypothetical protein n=1 Tax=Ruania zhangjianzhongii TaxID=2603206 RepID=UPI0011CBCBFE|nr:hypothetical protein [Ruania zhangjianzhongii]
MREDEHTPALSVQRAGGGAGAAVMLSCVVLLAASALGALVLGPLSRTAMPQPGDPEAPAYLAGHIGAIYLVAASQLVAAAALYVYGAYVPHAVRSVRRVRMALLVGVGVLVLAAVAGFALAVVAPVSDDAAIHVLHTVAWLSGGELHVATLGLYVAWLARSLLWSPMLRVTGALAGWCAVGALVVLVAPALGPFGVAARLLCLVWLLIAAHQSAFRDVA